MENREYGSRLGGVSLALPGMTLPEGPKIRDTLQQKKASHFSVGSVPIFLRLFKALKQPTFSPSAAGIGRALRKSRW
jgi:hypothetical protein